MKTQVFLVIALLWTAVLSRPSAPAASSHPPTPEKEEHKGWFGSLTGAVNKGFHDVVGVFRGGETTTTKTTTEAPKTPVTELNGLPSAPGSACSSAALASLACG